MGLTVCVLLAVFAALGWGLAARNGDERDRWKRRAEAAVAALFGFVLLAAMAGTFGFVAWRTFCWLDWLFTR